MRFVSAVSGGYRLFAVTGTNTVSFAVDFSAANTAGLLGFAVERQGPGDAQPKYLPGMKVFRSIIPNPTETTAVSTKDHPVQSFVWDDFTVDYGKAYSYWFHPVKGPAANLDRSAPPIKITVTTEDHAATETHDIYFNRGVASSQAYAREFDNQKPDDITDPAKQKRAFAWLSRGLDTALLKFISDVPAGDILLGSFYEFSFPAVLDALKAALDRGVKVRLIVDAKDNSSTDKQGHFHPADPRTANMAAVQTANLGAAIALWREHDPSDIQHNKFLVRLKGAALTPAEVWTGSTNITESGIYGQTNVGHRVRDAALAQLYTDYWNAMLPDPGSAKGDTKAVATKAKAAWRTTVEKLGAVPSKWADIQPGITPVFSPRSGGAMLALYVAALAESKSLACITLAFGINEDFKTRLVENNAQSAVTFLLLETEDLPNKRSKDPFVAINSTNNVYKAWGSFIEDPVYQWVRETNMRQLGIATHVAYIHSKFLLHDPLGTDPIVATGSANFSADSVNDNDENMLLIRGDQRVADIYFTEFNRLFFHYYFRSVYESTEHGAKPAANPSADASSSLFLDETDGWLTKYAPHTLRSKRVGVFTAMANAQPG